MIFCSNEDMFLNDIALYSFQDTGKRNWSQTPSNHFIDVRLMSEATEKIRPGFYNASKSWDCKIPEIPEKQEAFLCSCSHRLDIFVIWNVPRSQSKMTKHTAFIVPCDVNFGASFCGPPSRAWEEVLQTLRKTKACAVHSIHRGKVCKESIITDLVDGVYFCQGVTDHLLKKGLCSFVHALIHGFWRHLDMRAHLWHVRRQLGKGRLDVTPHPKGHQGQKECACQLRRAFDNAGAPGGGFDVVCRKAVCEHGYRTACTGRHGGLLGLV
jgi:hypothetical protein